MTVFAPFRFAPVNSFVYRPDWAHAISHDVPFKDGLSGEIEIELTARSEILIGGARRAPSAKREGEVWPFQLPDGRWAVPPASIQGMVRSAVELVTFGKMGPFVENRRFGIRDTRAAAAPFYSERLNSPVNQGSFQSEVKAGWLRLRQNGELELRPCQWAKIEFRDLADTLKIAQNRLTPKSSAQDRYKLAAGKLDQTLNVDAADVQYATGSVQVRFRKVKGTGPQVLKSGHLVLAAQVQDSPKHREAFFFDAGDPIVMDHARYTEFLSLHEPVGGKIHPAWQFLKDVGYPVNPFGAGPNPGFGKGGWMPVFYLADAKGAVDTFGVSHMFKIVHTNSTRQLLENTSADHYAAAPDFAELIFGFKPETLAGSGTEERPVNGLRRRASFDLAVAELPPFETTGKTGNVVLSSPKASYYPSYVEQPAGDDPGRLSGSTYATYTPLTGSLDSALSKPQLKGRKIYPASTSAQNAYSVQRRELPEVPQDKQGRINFATVSVLNYLPVGTILRTTLRFHNLRPFELGAILFALSCGVKSSLKQNQDSPDRQLRLGAGKPLGMGHVSVCFKAISYAQNDETERPDLGACFDSFKKVMTDACAAVNPGFVWQNSIQLGAFRTATQPNRNAILFLTYMKLTEGQPRSDSYVGAKGANHVLPQYGK